MAIDMSDWNKYEYKTPHLTKLLKVSRQTIVDWERKGKFKAPRNMKGERVFTANQMKSILQSFSPGGRGRWKFTP